MLETPERPTEAALRPQEFLRGPAAHKAAATQHHVSLRNTPPSRGPKWNSRGLGVCLLTSCYKAPQTGCFLHSFTHSSRGTGGAGFF